MTIQTEIEFGRIARDEGIRRSEQHANDVYSNWSEHAYELLKWFVEVNPGEFQAEDFRAEVKGLIPEPPHNRAYGGCFVRAAKAGLIQKVDIKPVNNPRAHCANAAVWKRV